MLTKTKNDLMERCQRGEHQAQMKVYDQYCKGMFIVARRILRDDAAAEDAVQEGFISAFMKMDQWNGESTFGAWLKRIVINKCLTSKRQADKMPLDPLDDQAVVMDESSLDLERSGRNADEVMEEINGLKDNYREILLLYYAEGMDHEEISQILKISYANCRTMLSRAKSSLRKKLELS